MKKAKKYINNIIMIITLLFLVGCNNIDKKAMTNEVSNVVYADETSVNEETTIKENEIISTYKTKFSKNVPGRNENIALAAKSINDKIIPAGETFSFNETIGATNKKNGYKVARVFDKGREAKGYGGGVCQVSSTLYNAALEANLEIIERHPHSKPVNYVPKNKDAATSYGKIDFKFKNNTQNPIKIITKTDETSVEIKLIRA